MDASIAAAMPVVNDIFTLKEQKVVLMTVLGGQHLLDFIP